jgi:hypothetical protein
MFKAHFKGVKKYLPKENSSRTKGCLKFEQKVTGKNVKKESLFLLTLTSIFS